MQVAGPGLGGLLAQALSAAWGLAVDAASFLVSAVCLWRLRLAPADEGARAAEPAAPLWTRVREGVDYLRRDRILRWFTVMGGVSNFGLTGYGALLVLFLVRDLGLSAAAVGVVMAVGSVGGLPRRRRGHPPVDPVRQRPRPACGCGVVAGPGALLLPLATPGRRHGVPRRRTCCSSGARWWRATSSAAPGATATCPRRWSPAR